MDKIEMKLKATSSFYSEDLEHESADFGWTAKQEAQSVSYTVHDLKDLARARKLGKPYPTEGVTYVFDFANTIHGEPCTITEYNIDQHNIISYTVQLVPGEDFKVEMPVSSLDDETRKNIYVGNTVYVKMKFDNE